MYTQSLYVFFLVVYIYKWSARAETLCYYPDGSIPSDWPNEPCNSTVEGVHSACCARGDICSTKGYCFSGTDIGSGFIYRGGCTDQTWTSDQCNRHCRDSAIHSFSNVFLCAWKNGSGTKDWCCSGQSGSAEAAAGCCDTTLFDIGIAGGFGSFFVSTYESNISATNNSASSATQSIPSSKPWNQPACSPGANSTASQNAPITKPQQDSYEPVVIGVGVGIPLGVIAFASLLLLFREHKLRLRAESTAGTINDKRFNKGKRTERAVLEGDNHNAPQELGQEPRLPNELNSEEIYEIAAHG